MTRLIVISSGKGGVGKTTLTSNLTAALTDFGQKVIAIDGNITTANLGLHLGLHLTKTNLQNVLKGESNLENAIYPHPYGFKVMPASIGLNNLKEVDITRLPEITFRMLGKADYIIIDCAAGIGKEAICALSSSDETIVVVNPNLTSVTDALKILKIAEESNLKILGIVVNRVKDEEYELTSEHITEILGVPIIAEIPEDVNIPKSINEKKTILEYEPFSPASVEIMKLAASLTGKKYEPPKIQKNFFERVFDLFRR